MGFFEELGEKLAATGAEVSQKAKEVSEVASLRNQIRQQEKTIDEIYIKLGKKYFEAHKDDVSDESAEDIASIITALAGIDTLNQQINEIKGCVSCPSCGTAVEDSSVFCSKCGTKIGE